VPPWRVAGQLYFYSIDVTEAYKCCYNLCCVLNGTSCSYRGEMNSEQAIDDSRQEVVLQFVALARSCHYLPKKASHVMNCYTGPQIPPPPPSTILFVFQCTRRVSGSVRAGAVCFYYLTCIQDRNRSAGLGGRVLPREEKKIPLPSLHHHISASL
jgi:hypothetical protein